MIHPTNTPLLLTYRTLQTQANIRVPHIHYPVLGLFGEEDHGIPVEDVRAFEKELEKFWEKDTQEKRQIICFANQAGRIL